MKEIYQLNNFANLSIDLNRPLNKTHRIKYTCYDASTNYIVCGATSGSLYLFQRQPCKFLQLIPNLYGAISHVAISPQEHFIAFTTQKGTILVYVIDLTAVQPVVVSSYYREMCITQLKWKQNECQLFFGDMKGNVFLVNLNNFLGRNLTNISIHPILFLESPVVQICEFEQLLLVSNYTKCILCNTETEEFKQIGNQPRDGKFGACFLLGDGENDGSDSLMQTARIVCARPGSRMWECSLDGNVLQTHKFKSAFNSIAPTQIRGFDESKSPTSAEKSQSNQIVDHLVNLQAINGFYVLGYTSNKFYVFDMIHSSVVLWNDSFESIHTVKVIEDDPTNTIVLFTKDYKAYTFQLMQLDRVLYESVTKERFYDSGRLMLQNAAYFQEKVTDLTFRYYYSILQTKLAYCDDDSKMVLEELRTRFDNLLTKYSEMDENVQKFCGPNNVRVVNGVYLIENSFSLANSKRTDIRTTMYGSTEDFLDAIEDETPNILSSYDDEIVVSTKPSANTINADSLVRIEPKPLTEDDKIVQNLFFIYKSLKISNFNLVDRYADLFDRYDLPGLMRLLSELESMILENDKVSKTEAKQHCARMYLNYVKIDATSTWDQTTYDFVIDCFVASNVRLADDSIQRCFDCNFPLIVEMTTLKYREIADIVVKYLLGRQEQRRLMKCIESVPALLNFVLKTTIAEKFDTPSKTTQSDFDSILDMIFGCANQLQLEQCVHKYSALRTVAFWNGFFARLKRLLCDKTIKCIRCNTLCPIDLSLLAESKPFYTYDYALNVCADSVNGLVALDFCGKVANFVPSDAISKQFYLKCLMNS